LAPFDHDITGTVGTTGEREGLKPVTVDNRVTLRIPKRWNGRRREKGIWGFFEEGQETSTLWVQSEIYRFPDQEPGEIELLAPLIAERLTEEFANVDLAYRNVEMFDLPAGKVIRAYFDEREDGQLLRFYRWQHVQAHSAAITMVFFSLVLPRDLVEEPRFQGLVKVMDREIRTAQVVHAIN
jgi:hypothetical protein